MMHQNKRYVEVYNATKDCPLDLPGLITYSYLHKWGSPMSQADLARGTALDRKTISLACESLLMNGMVEVDGKLYTATIPDTNWFRPFPDGKAYFFWRYYLPTVDNLLTPVQNAVYCLMLSFKGLVARKSLAGMLRVHRTTAERAAKKLVELRLAELVGNQIKTAPMPPEMDSWWQDTLAAKEEERAKMTFNLSPLIEHTLRTHPDEGVYWEMRIDFNYPEEDIKMVRNAARLMPKTVIKKLLYDSENSHDRAQYPGSSARLLLNKIKEWLKKYDENTRLYESCMLRDAEFDRKRAENDAKVRQRELALGMK